MRVLLSSLLLAALISGCGGLSNSYINHPDVIEPNRLGTSEFADVIDWSAPDYEKINAACHLATNEARIAQGGQGLRWNATLEKAASAYAEESARGGFLAHEHPSNSAMRLPDQRVAAAGGANPITSENLAWIPGYPIGPDQGVHVRQGGYSITADGPLLRPHTYASLARTVVEGWLNSPGHRANLLDRNAREVGCGSYMTPDANGMSMVTFVQKFQVSELLK